MALSFDFSVILRRLDRSIHDLQHRDGDHVFPKHSPLVRDADCSLRECLEEMTKRGLRTTLIHYPKGVSSQPRKSRHRVSSASSSFRELQPEVKKTSDEALPSTPKIHIEKSAESTSPRSLVKARDAALDHWAHEKYQFLDMRDVLCLLLEKYDDVYGPLGEKSDLPAHDFLTQLLDLEVGEVANMSGRNGFSAAYDCCTLRQLLQRFEDSPRVPVFEYKQNGDDNINPSLVGIFSVIDLLQLLNGLTVESTAGAGFFPGQDPMTTFAKKPSLTAIDTWTAGMIKTVTQPARAKKYSELHICFEDESLFDAMKVLYKTGFSALPLVAKSNPRQCLGVFSVRDLQPILLQKTDLLISGALLSVPIMDYVSSIRQMQSLKARYPVIHVRHNATIDAVIGKILASNVRRLILTDDDGSLSGILSVTDLGRFISRELAGKSS